MAIGRPRAFDMDQALDRALDVFWRKGYEGASICDLTAAMGINPPSLYAAFGNKEGLFRQALDRYAAMHDVFLARSAGAAEGEGLYRGAAAPHRRGPDGQEQPRRAACWCRASPALASMPNASATSFAPGGRANEKTIRERLKRAKTEGDLPKDADPAALARFVATVTQGMAVQAAGGASRAELEAGRRHGAAAFPE